MRADREREALRLLMTVRDNAVQSGKTARTVLTSVIVTAPAALREELRHLPAECRARACASLTCPPGADQLTRVMHQTLVQLGQRATALTEVATASTASATGNSTAPFTSSPSAGCAATRPPSPTPRRAG
jgi:hypothetical protein